MPSTEAAAAAPPLSLPAGARVSGAGMHRQPAQRASRAALERSFRPAAPPVELQVETMSSISTRVFLYTWYAALIAALVVESSIGLQWVSRNFCGDATVSVHRLEDWNSSSCISWASYWVHDDRSVTRDGWLAEDRIRWNSTLDSQQQKEQTEQRQQWDYVAWPPEGSVLASSGSARRCQPPALSASSSSRAHRAISPAWHSDSLDGYRYSAPTPGPTMPPLRRVYKLRWTADALSGVMKGDLNRFLHVFVSLASPLASASAPAAVGEPTDEQRTVQTVPSPPFESSPSPALLWKTYEVWVALEETAVTPPHNNSDTDSNSRSSDSESSRHGRPSASSSRRSSSSSAAAASSSSSSSASGNGTVFVYTFQTSVTCWRTASRCTTIVLPPSVVVPANQSRLTITLINVEAELAEATLRSVAPAAPTRTTTRISRAHGDAWPKQTAAPRFSWQHLAHATPLLGLNKAPATGVGVMYQRSSYTVATILFRYAFLFLTLISTFSFLYRSLRAPRMLYEQKWTLALQIGLLLYLNPLYWWCLHTGREVRNTSDGSSSSRHTYGGGAAFSTSQPTPLRSDASWFHIPFVNVSSSALRRVGLYYVEFHIPTFFVALVVCYTWAVVAGTFRWSAAALSGPSAASTTAEAEGEGDAAGHAAAAAVGAATNGRRGGTSASRRLDMNDEAALAPAPAAAAAASVVVTVSSSQVARHRVRVFLVLFMLVVVTLDVARSYVEWCSWMDGGEVMCRSPRCLRLQTGTEYVLVGGVLSSGVGLYWLRRNLARHPYLSTRPQQLACRIMILMYFTGGLYCVLQLLLLRTLYKQLTTILYFQPLVQFSHLLVLTSFVLHMTYVYTATQSSRQIPLRPTDPRWKTVGWSARWYRWLDWHGGSLYVFFNEAEERTFYDVQVAFQLAKRGRKERRKLAKSKRGGTGHSQQRREEQPPQPPPTAAVTWAEEHSEDRVPPHRTATTAASATALNAHRTPPQLGPDGGAPTAPSRMASTALFNASAATLSVLSDPEETDWFMIDSALPSRTHRTLSTATQASSSIAEGRRSRSPGELGVEEGHSSYGGGVDTRPPSPSSASPLPLPLHAGSAALRGASGGTNDRSSGGGAAGHQGGGATVPTSNTGRGHQGGNRATRSAIRRVPSRFLTALHEAESRLVEGTATFVDLLAEKCVDRPLQVLLGQRARQQFVFFNLETAIDCLNLSREAYAVQESRGDGLIRTGIQVDAGQVPRAALTLVERAVALLFGLCFKRATPLEPEGIDVVVEGDEGEAGEEEAAVTVDEVDSCVTTPTHEPEREPLLQSARSGRAKEFDARRGEGLPQPAAVARPAAPHTHTPPHPEQTSAPAATVTTLTQHVASPSSSSPSSPSRPAAASPSSTAAAAPLPPMNLAQYGYRTVAVFDTRGVQVVVARMDVSGSCPVHAGKAPRLTIAFRGTDNVANVLEDIRFRQRTWKEMETPTLLPRASVHSGFLELWMSLKASVLDVVLQELRAQHSPATAAAAAESAEAMGVALSPHDSLTPNTEAEGKDKEGNGLGVFDSPEPFSSQWAALHAHSTAPPPSSSSTPQLPHSSGYLRVFVTGHSLGGALACLCAYSLRRMLLLAEYPEPDIAVYTYGQPRIGNSVFKQYYNRAIPRTFRVVNESDVVSGFNIFGGHHVGVQVNVDRHGNYVCKPMSIERLLRPTRGRGLALMNHTLAAYACSLNAVADVYAHGACPVRCLEPYMDDVISVSSEASDEETERGLSGRRRLQREEKEVDGARAPE